MGWPGSFFFASGPIDQQVDVPSAGAGYHTIGEASPSSPTSSGSRLLPRRQPALPPPQVLAKATRPGSPTRIRGRLTHPLRVASIPSGSWILSVTVPHGRSPGRCFFSGRRIRSRVGWLTLTMDTSPEMQSGGIVRTFLTLQPGASPFWFLRNGLWERKESKNGRTPRPRPPALALPGHRCAEPSVIGTGPADPGHAPVALPSNSEHTHHQFIWISYKPRRIFFPGNPETRQRRSLFLPIFMIYFGTIFKTCFCENSEEKIKQISNYFF